MIRELKILLGILALVVLVLVIWILVSFFAIWGVEQPQYILVQEAKGYEVRDYPSHTVFETMAKGTLGEASNAGFKTLFDYISARQIKMTAPVVVRTVGEMGNTHIVSFYIPAGLKVETYTGTSTIKVRNIEEQHFAVYTFTGLPTDERIYDEKQKFLRMLTRDDVVLLSDFVFARYNPPFTIPFLMKNEIWVAI